MPKSTTISVGQLDFLYGWGNNFLLNLFLQLSLTVIGLSMFILSYVDEKKVEEIYKDET